MGARIVCAVSRISALSSQTCSVIMVNRTKTEIAFFCYRRALYCHHGFKAKMTGFCRLSKSWFTDQLDFYWQNTKWKSCLQIVMRTVVGRAVRWCCSRLVSTTVLMQRHHLSSWAVCLRACDLICTQIIKCIEFDYTSNVREQIAYHWAIMCYFANVQYMQTVHANHEWRACLQTWWFISGRYYGILLHIM